MKVSSWQRAVRSKTTGHRAFVLFCLLTAFLLSTGLQAQQLTNTAVVGLLRPGSPPDPYVAAFRKSLRDLGQVEGQTTTIEIRWLEGKSERLPSLAAELVRLNVDVIVTQGESMTRPVKQATGTIPIVMATSGDPLGAGLIASLARPGANVTGLSSVSADISGKRLQLLKEAIPKVTRVAMLYNPTIRSAVLEINGTQRAAPPLGIKLQTLEMRSAADLVVAFDALTREGADALLVQGDLLQRLIVNAFLISRPSESCPWSRSLEILPVPAAL